MEGAPYLEPVTDVAPVTFATVVMENQPAEGDTVIASVESESPGATGDSEQTGAPATAGEQQQATTAPQPGDGDSASVPADGGDGADSGATIIPAAAAAPILTVAIGAGVAVAGGGANTDLDIAVAEPDSYQITGTGDSNFIQGGSGGQSIDAGAGDDAIYGDSDYVNSGEDAIKAGAGNDQVTGGDSADRILGGEGADTIYGDFQSPSPNAGKDEIDAGEGNDTVIGGDSDDSIAGGAGDDVIQGDFDWETAGGADRIDAGPGNDTVIGGAGDDVIAGGSGDDTIHGDYRWSTSAGNDVVVYRGTRDQYQITRNDDGSYTVADLVADRDGTDRVYNIENFRFADGDVGVSDILSGVGGGLAVESAIEYPVDIAVALADPGGAETLSSVMIDMAGVPEGTIFSAGSLVDGKWVLAPNQLDGLTMRVPADTPAFRLDVSVTATESDSGDASTMQVAIGVGGPDHGVVVTEEPVAAMAMRMVSSPLGDDLAAQTSEDQTAVVADDTAAAPTAAEDQAGLAPDAESSPSAAEQQADTFAAADQPDGDASAAPVSGETNGAGLDDLAAASSDSVQPYLDLAAQAQPDSALAAMQSEPAESAVSEYMALAQPQDGSETQSAQPAEGAAADDYIQMAADASPSGDDQQQPLSPDQIFADTAVDPGMGGATAPDSAPPDDAMADAPIPDPSASPDEQHHLGG